MSSARSDNAGRKNALGANVLRRSTSRTRSALLRNSAQTALGAITRVHNNSPARSVDPMLGRAIRQTRNNPTSHCDRRSGRLSPHSTHCGHWSGSLASSHDTAVQLRPVREVRGDAGVKFSNLPLGAVCSSWLAGAHRPIINSATRAKRRRALEPLGSLARPLSSSFPTVFEVGADGFRGMRAWT